MTSGSNNRLVAMVAMVAKAKGAPNQLLPNRL
jgi:hypothetical protein